MSDTEGIYDTSAGRCTAGLNLEGQEYRCDLSISHEGWPHSNQEAQALWECHVKWGAHDD